MTMSPSREINPDPKRRDDGDSHIIAAQIRNESKQTPLNVVFCSDIDMITDWFFMERNRGMLDVKFDNVTFVLNAVDCARRRRDVHSTAVPPGEHENS
ncbi:MAG UNVERIFIED_CONTAM: hypothetical protein LVR18_05100 [Planctomycetaceae bacterium]|jgi:ABC-2 type transport system permease protein